MPREMFTSAPPATPRRSKWTIVGSIVIHFALVGALVIIPVLSAFDSFVVRANESLKFILPVVAVPNMPAQPKSSAPNISPDIKVNAAPTSPPQEPVTTEVTAPPTDFVGRPDGRPGSRGTGAPVGGNDGTGVEITAPLPTPTPAPAGPIRPGGDIKFPTRTFYKEPVYPSIARTARIEGTVYLEATIDATGVVRDVRVLKSIPLLDEAAKAAVSQWKYTPTKLNGVAVPVLLTVTVTFTIR